MRNFFLIIIGIILLVGGLGVAEAIDITVETGEGKFVFKNVLFEKNWLDFSRLKGSVRNETDKDWKEISFEVYLLSETGAIEEALKLPIYNIRKKQTMWLDMPIMSPKKITGKKIEMLFKEGSYPVEYKFKMVKPIENDNASYEDAAIKISFAIQKKQIGFILLNKTDNVIKVDWNQLSFIDIESVSHKVFHSSVKYINKDAPQVPTNVPPQSKINEVILPIDNVYYSSGRFGGWNEIPLFPDGPESKMFKGKTIGVFMPLEINGVLKNYSFSFKVE